MTTKTVTIQLESGLGARPIALLVQEASKYEASVYLQSGDRKINAKSIMGMMSLGLESGETLTILTDGVDEAAAAAGVENFLSGK